MLMKAQGNRADTTGASGARDAVPGAAPDDLKIGDLARATGKTARALRLYEEMGLLCPGDRTQGGFRMYDARAIARVRFISELQDMGFTLHDVKALIDATAAREIPREAMTQVRHTFETKLDELDAQIARLTALRAEVKTALAYLDTCGDCALVEHGVVQCVSCDDHAGKPLPHLVGGVADAALERRPSATDVAAGHETASRRATSHDGALVLDSSPHTKAART